MSKNTYPLKSFECALSAFRLGPQTMSQGSTQK
jgi:hypothetical protein